MFKNPKTAAVSLLAVAALALGATGCEGTTTGSSTTGGTSAAKSKKADAPEKTVVVQFKEFVAKNGTANEQAAVKHVTKIIGGDNNNDILDSAEVHTDYTGDMISDDAKSGKLIATSFAQFQADRGNKSKNGMVTIYNGKGELLSNGQF